MPAAADGEVTSRKLNLTISSANVTTAETTTSTSYADLATSGPSVTITTGITQDHLSMMSADLDNSGASHSFAAAFVNGADAQDNWCAKHRGTAAEANGFAHRHHTSAVSGTEYRGGYRVDGNTGTFANRHITGMAL